MKVADLQMQGRMYPLDPKKTNLPKDQNPAGTKAGQVQETKPFAEILQEKLNHPGDVKFSAHAMKRLEQRNVDLSDQQLTRLDGGMRQLQEKGSKNSLIMMDDTAFVVSVQNKTVVTAVNKEQSVNNVFTNIDSVAIV